MTERKESYDIFLSYSHEDTQWASEFASTLRAFGYRTWTAQENIHFGENLYDAIAEALRQSRILVMILSSNSIESPSMFFELGAAFADHKRIIPILSEDIDPHRIPVMLTNLPYLRPSSASEAAKYVAEVIAKTSTKDV